MCSYNMQEYGILLPSLRGRGWGVGLICKYNLCSKKVLQMKNRFWRFQNRFFYAFCRVLHPSLSIQGFFALQMDYSWKANGLQLQRKCSSVSAQKLSFCSEKELFCVCDFY